MQVFVWLKQLQKQVLPPKCVERDPTSLPIIASYLRKQHKGQITRPIALQMYCTGTVLTFGAGLLQRCERTAQSRPIYKQEYSCLLAKQFLPEYKILAQKSKNVLEIPSIETQSHYSFIIACWAGIFQPLLPVPKAAFTLVEYHP